jgi:hypothetical protein
MLMPRGMFKGLIKFQQQRINEARKAHRDRLKAADQLAAELLIQSEVIMHAYQLINGSQPSARRRNVFKDTETDNPNMTELRDLVERAGYGNESAIIDLRALLNAMPELWKQVGDLAKHVETVWIKLLSGNNPLTRECLHREAERRRIELLGDNATPIERHLIETIVASWLQLRHAEMQMANSMRVTDSQLNFFHRRLESAQKQHRTAIDQLVKIRKMVRTTKRKARTSRSQLDCNQPSRKSVGRRVVDA